MAGIRKQAAGRTGIAIAPDGRTVYVTQQMEGGALLAFAVEPGGRLVPRDTVGTGESFPKEPAVTPDGRFLYVSHGQPVDEHESLITGFAIEPDGGFGDQVAKETAGRSGAQTVITPDGGFVYSTQQASDEVVGWRIASDGSLSEVARLPVGDFVEGAAISPDGTLLYVGSFGGPPRLDGQPDPTRPSALFGFRIDAYGGLTPVAEVPTIDPIGLAFSPDGRRLHVSAYTTDTANSLKTFAVDPAGGLTQLQAIESGGPLPAFHSVNIPPARWSCQTG